MRKSAPILLIILLIWLLFYNQYVLADLTDQCILGIPTYTKPLVTGKPDQLPVHIQAERAVEHYHKSTQFFGNVNITYGNGTLTADQVELHQQHNDKNKLVRTITAYGNVSYFSDKIRLTGQKALVNLNTQDIDVYHGSYQMVGQQGRGEADVIKQYGDNRNVVLKNGSFTTCLPGDDSWRILGSKIIYNRQRQVAEIWDSSIKVGTVPVFYSPYLRLPVGDERRSGFLIPSIQYSSNNKFALGFPYYFNLAPHYDVTITPNYISRRGTQIQIKCRYLTFPGEGLVEFNWLPNDLVYNLDHPNNNNSDRWQLHWYYDTIVGMFWHFNIDYNVISNSNYFNDLHLKYDDTVNSYAVQKFCLDYASKNWQATLAYKKFQLIDTDIDNIYLAVPQLNITFYKNGIGPFDFKVFSQLIKFTNVNSDFPEATRLHIEPTINLPLANSWGNLNTEVKLMVTHYQQSNINNNDNKVINTKQRLDSSISRVMPQFKTDGKMVLKRDIEFFHGYTQTLEPRLQYLYVPYRNQNSIGIYDSVILHIDYTGLFRDRTYSGLDYILSANRLASGITSRIYDDKLVERFNISVGQIYYFSWPRIYDRYNNKDHYDHTGSIIWIGNSYWYISNKWGFRCDIQYDANVNHLTLGEMVLEYQQDKNRILQFNYRYANLRYIKQRLPKGIYSGSGYQQGIYQIGMTGSWPIVDRWLLVGAYYHDTNINQPIDQLVCVQYSTCCWAVNISYQRKITNWNYYYNLGKYDKKLMFNIELRGLSNTYSLSKDKILSSSLLPYQRVL